VASDEGHALLGGLDRLLVDVVLSVGLDYDGSAEEALLFFF
jgi:hypothetical protein